MYGKVIIDKNFWSTKWEKEERHVKRESRIRWEPICWTSYQCTTKWL